MHLNWNISKTLLLTYKPSFKWPTLIYWTVFNNESTTHYYRFIFTPQTAVSFFDHTSLLFSCVAPSCSSQCSQQASPNTTYVCVQWHSLKQCFSVFLDFFVCVCVLLFLDFWFLLFWFLGSYVLFFVFGFYVFIVCFCEECFYFVYIVWGCFRVFCQSYWLFCVSYGLFCVYFSLVGFCGVFVRACYYLWGLTEYFNVFSNMFFKWIFR